MADQQRRNLERQAQDGDLAAEARLLAERLRLGELSEERLALAALVGDAGARALSGDPADEPPLLELMRALGRWGKPTLVRAALAAAETCLPVWHRDHPDWPAERRAILAEEPADPSWAGDDALLQGRQDEPDRLLSAARDWLREPSPAHEEALADRLGQATCWQFAAGAAAAEVVSAAETSPASPFLIGYAGLALGNACLALSGSRCHSLTDAMGPRERQRRIRALDFAFPDAAPVRLAIRRSLSAWALS